MWRSEGSLKIFAGAAARIEMATPKQPAPGGKVEGPSAALHIWSKRPALVRPLLPADPEPAQIFECGFGKHRFTALRVQVFHAHHECATRIARPLPRSPECARVAHMQIARWRRRKPAAVARCRRRCKAGHTTIKCRKA